MQALILDLETTGLKQETGDRIIEIALLRIDLDSGLEVGRFEARVNPQRPISAEAYHVHGILLTDLAHEPIWDEVARKLRPDLERGDVLVAHNVEFDVPFLAGELIRIKEPVPDIPVFCTMENGRWATPTGKKPSLKELAFALKVPYDSGKAHGAGYDAGVTAKCLIAGVRRGFFKIPLNKSRRDAA
jgi:DNA polymerase-3 subunit epsilon